MTTVGSDPIIQIYGENKSIDLYLDKLNIILSKDSSLEIPIDGYVSKFGNNYKKILTDIENYEHCVKTIDGLKIIKITDRLLNIIKSSCPTLECIATFIQKSEDVVLSDETFSEYLEKNRSLEHMKNFKEVNFNNLDLIKSNIGSNLRVLDYLNMIVSHLDNKEYYLNISCEYPNVSIMVKKSEKGSRIDRLVNRTVKRILGCIPRNKRRKISKRPNDHTRYINCDITNVVGFTYDIMFEILLHLADTYYSIVKEEADNFIKKIYYCVMAKIN